MRLKGQFLSRISDLVLLVYFFLGWCMFVCGVNIPIAWPGFLDYSSMIQNLFHLYMLQAVWREGFDL